MIRTHITFILLALLSFSVVALDCPQGSVFSGAFGDLSNPTYYSSADAACQAFASFRSSNDVAGRLFEVVSVEFGYDSVNIIIHFCTIGTMEGSTNGTPVDQSTINVVESCSSCVAPEVWDEQAQQCVVPDPTCDLAANAYGESFTLSRSSLPDSICNNLTAYCTYTAVGGGSMCIHMGGSSCLVTREYELTSSQGDACPSGIDQTENADDMQDANNSADGETPENCISSSEQTLCLDTGDGAPGENCGLVNGEYVCYDAVPDGGCTFLENGSYICDSDAPPLVDSNGDPLQPDASFTDNDGNVTNIYGEGTVGSSSGTTTGTNNPNSDGPSTSSGSVGDGEGDGTCEGSETDCGDGGAYVPGGADDWYQPDESKTFGTVLDNFTAQAAQTPFVGAANSFFTVTIASGACPIWVMDTVIVGQLTVDAQCSPWMESLWPIVRAILIAFAAFTAFRWAFM